MNLTNKILILIVLLLLINHLTDGQIIKTFGNYLFVCQDRIENFMGVVYDRECITQNVPVIPFATQKDFKYLNNNPDIVDDETYYLYEFINELVTKNTNMYELTGSSGEQIPGSQSLRNLIFNEITRLFNCGEWKFLNIKSSDPIFWNENPRGIEISPFNFRADVYHGNKSLGNIKLYVECFLHSDKFNRDHSAFGYLTFLNIKVLDRYDSSNSNINPFDKSAYRLKSISDTEKKAISKNNELTGKMMESFNSHFVSRNGYEDLFIKPTQTVKNTPHTETENSLIPSIIELSAFA